MTDYGDAVIQLLERLADPSDPIRHELQTAAGKKKHLASVPEGERAAVVAGLKEPNTYQEVLQALKCINQYPPTTSDPSSLMCVAKLMGPPPTPPEPSPGPTPPPGD
jgi:hypothetical protein